MEIDRKELKRQARERMVLTDPKFWVVALAYIVMTTGVSWLFSLIPTPDVGASPVDTFQLFFQLLLILYTAVVQFGLCLWALWAYRQLDPGINSLMQGFSVAGRVLLMRLGIYARILGWYFLVSMGLSFPVVALLMRAEYAGAVTGFLLYWAALVVVLIVLELRYALAPYLLADRPDDGPTAPILRSAALMRGWKWELFKLEFSFIGWEILNFIFSAAVVLFFLSQAGLLASPNLADPNQLFQWTQECAAIAYSTPVVILSTLVTVPVSLWLIPYRATARAGFYDARMLAASRGGQNYPEMPPL